MLKKKKHKEEEEEEEECNNKVPKTKLSWNGHGCEL